MSEAEDAKGNGSAGGTWGAAQGPQSLGDHGRQIQHDAAALATAVGDAADDVQRYLAEQVEERPFTTLSVAAGVGFVLGGGLSARLTVLLLGTATRLATAIAARELSARLLRRGSASVLQTSA
jgi:hypothetical protein